jgi:hypothetical protein
MLMSGECHFLFLMATWCCCRWAIRVRMPADPAGSESGEWKCALPAVCSSTQEGTNKGNKELFFLSPSISQRATATSLSRLPARIGRCTWPAAKFLILAPGQVAKWYAVCICLKWITPAVTAISSTSTLINSTPRLIYIPLANCFVNQFFFLYSILNFLLSFSPKPD